MGAAAAGPRARRVARDDAPVSDTSDGLRLLASLRATRAFTGEPVPDDALAAILEVGRWTGSARNRQPWRVVVVRDRDRRVALSRLGAYAQVLAGAPLVLLLAIDSATGGVDAEFDAGRLAQAMMLAAHAHGLGCCPATLFPDENVRRATAAAGLAPPWRVRTAIAVGRPGVTPRGRRAIPSGRRPIEEFRIDLP